MFIARLSAQWANWRSIERKKKSRKSTGAPWIYASSYVPWIVPWSTIHHLTIPHYELGVLQFKIPNEHKFDRLLTSTRAVFDENEYISTLASKKTKGCANFYWTTQIIDFSRWKKLHHVENWLKWFLLSFFFRRHPQKSSPMPKHRFLTFWNSQTLGCKGKIFVWI